MANDSYRMLKDLALYVMAEFAGVKVHPVTIHLVWHLLLDLPLTPAQEDDFGVETSDHYRAMRAVLDADHEHGLGGLGEELDRAMGNGEALTRLVQKYAPQYKSLRFETVWDHMRP